jgi:hypothetical protein
LADWVKVNPVLAEGEPGYETDTGKIKFGNGVARWTELDYLIGAVPPNLGYVTDDMLIAHINSIEPHTAYDDGPSLLLLYQNAKV